MLWNLYLPTFVLLLILSCVGCKKQPTGSASSNLTTSNPPVLQVFSHRHYPADKQLIQRFTELTRIKVEVTQNQADELIKRMQIQGKDCIADVLITVDAGRLVRAKEKGLLQPVSSAPLTKRIPSHLRDPQGYWFGLTKRARIVVYAKDRVKPEDIPTYESLTSPKWKGRILVRSSNNIYNQSLLASLIAAEGETKAKAWAQGMVANFARSPKGNDRDQMKAIAAKQGDIAIVNTYYIGTMIRSKNPAEREVAQSLGVLFPNQSDRGAHVNISGAGVAKYARHPEAARKFLEFLASTEAQKIFATANYEYPVHPKVPASSLIYSWGSFKEHHLNLSLLGQHNRKAVDIFDAVGWR